MNFNKVKVVIGREYFTRVKKKSFLITTFLVPILFAIVCILPSLIMFGAKEKMQKVGVVDESGIVMSKLESNKTALYVDYSDMPVDSLKNSLTERGLDVLLHISPLDTINKTVTAKSYSVKPLGVDFAESLTSKVNQAVEQYRVDTYGIDGLDKIMDDVKSNISVTEYLLDKSGKETISESGIYMMLSMFAGMIIFMFISMFGGQVMSSVIEEKSSRVVEVLISSVKATELMFGKIIGVALVALTQFMLWIVLTVILVTAFMGIFGKKMMSDVDTQQIAKTMTATPGMGDMGSTIDLATAMNDTTSVSNGQISQKATIFSTLGNIPWGTIAICFVIYFILGYLLYASMYAAIGSSVENEADTQQLQLPVTIPLMLGFFLAFYCMKDPDGAVAFWGSMIPFTSPIVMLARIPYGVPFWEIAVSIAVLILTFIVFAWGSAKIYKAGILMFGKKSSFKDLWKWLKQK